MGKRLSYLIRIIIVAAVYLGLGKLAMTIAADFGTVSPLRPASGMALGALLVFGKGVWPGIFLGALLANYTPGVPLWICLATGVGNAISPLFGLYLVKRFCDTDKIFNQVRDIFKLTLLVCIIAPIVDTTIGVGSLYIGGIIRANDLAFSYFSWWVAGATGVVVITPMVLTWLDKKTKWKRPAEYLALLGLAMLISHLIFSGWIAGSLIKSLNWKFILLPFYVWLVFRFGPREIATTTFMVEVVACYDALSQFGTMSGLTIGELLLSLEVFVSFIMIAALVLNAMVNERKRMIEDLARLEKLNLLGEMAAGIAHEIRNPMTTVRGFLQMLSANRENTQQAEFYSLMINELDRANTIISEYLMLARNKPAQLTKQSVNKVIQAIQPLITADALNSDMSVELLLGEVPEIPIEEKEIRQLILNFVRNGLEAMGPGGKLTIRTFVEKNRVVISFMDEGQGIDPQVLKNLGTPFLTTKENGTGLGLAVSYSIAARHNATVKVDTGPMGTTFYVKFKIDTRDCHLDS